MSTPNEDDPQSIEPPLDEEDTEATLVDTPLDIAPPTPAPPRISFHLLSGTLAGALVGLIEGYTAAHAEGLPPLPGDAILATLALATLLNTLTGSLLGLLGGLSWSLFTRYLVPAQRVKTWLLSRWGLATLGLGVILAASALPLYSALVNPLDWDALDWRWFGLPLIFAAGYAGTLLLTRIKHPAPRPALASITALLVLWLLLAGWQSPQAHDASLLRVGTETGHSKKILLGGRTALFDSDGDAFPTAFCTSDCDCDDTNPAVFPGAVDEPGNGIDEDCDGSDLTQDELDAYVAMLAPKKKVTPPPAPKTPDSTAGPEPEEEPTPKPLLELTREGPPNLLFIVVDTLRADHLGLYGYERDTSPRLDALAERAVVFEQARATGSQTRFSVPPMLTGKYFTEIERTESKWPKVSLDEHLLAERLKEGANYHTLAWHSVGYFNPIYHFDQGYDHYDFSCIGARDPVQRSATGDYITDRVLSYVERNDLNTPQPFHMWVYYSDPHSAYLFHDDFPRWGPHRSDAYDAEIAFTDHHIGRLIDGLQEKGLLENTVVVLTSDHGEGLDKEDDHGKLYHGPTLYDEVMRVPLLVWAPGLEPQRIKTPVSLIDLLPTFLELAGLPEDPELRGVSLVPWLAGERPEHPPVFFEKHKSEALPQKGMVQWPFKVILVMPYNRVEIYNLEEDPRERNNLAKALPEAEREKLVGLLKYWSTHVIEEKEAVKRFKRRKRESD